MDRLQPLPGAWDLPVETVLARYLETIEDTVARAEVAQRLRAALRAEPIARGCPTLAMLRPGDLAGVRGHLELTDRLEGIADPGAVEATVAALGLFLEWARAAGAHALPADVVRAALAGPGGDPDADASSPQAAR